MKPHYHGYVVDHFWKKLEIHTFDHQTKKRIRRTIIRPLDGFIIHQRYDEVCKELKKFGLPVPPPNF